MKLPPWIIFRWTIRPYVMYYNTRGFIDRVWYHLTFLSLYFITHNLHFIISFYNPSNILPHKLSHILTALSCSIFWRSTLHCFLLVVSYSYNISFAVLPIAYNPYSNITWLPITNTHAHYLKLDTPPRLFARNRRHQKKFKCYRPIHYALSNTVTLDNCLITIVIAPLIALVVPQPQPVSYR